MLYEYRIAKVLTSVAMREFHNPVGPESKKRLRDILNHLSNLGAPEAQKDTKEFAYGAALTLRFWDAYAKLESNLVYARRNRINRFDRMLHVLNGMAEKLGEENNEIHLQSDCADEPKRI